MLTCTLYQFRSEPIYSSTTGVVALKSVTVWYSCKLSNTDTATALPRQTILFILTLHHLVWEAALKEVKVEGVHRNQLWQEHGFQRLFPIQTVSEHETGTLTRVCMQVNIHADLSIIDLLFNSGLDCPDGRLLLFVWIDVVTVQVLTQRVKSVIPTVDSVWI